MSKTAIVQPGQTIFDIAIQEYGDLSGLADLAGDNNKSLTADIAAGENLKVGQTKNKPITDFYKGRNIKPATGTTESEIEQLKPEGIGYWAIEYDFEVS